MSKVYCDKCKYYIGVRLKEQDHPRNISEVYFKCNHCYEHYTVSVTNIEARKLQRKAKRKKITRDEWNRMEHIVSTLKNNLINYGVADIHGAP